MKIILALRVTLIYYFYMALHWVARTGDTIMTTIKTKQGNELALETFNGAVYVRTPKGAFKIGLFDFITGKVCLPGVNGGFFLADNIDKLTLVAAITKAEASNFPALTELDESALDESMAALEGICRDL